MISLSENDDLLFDDISVLTQGMGTDEYVYSRRPPIAIAPDILIPQIETTMIPINSPSTALTSA